MAIRREGLDSLGGGDNVAAVARMLSLLAERGQGTLLGVAPTDRAGIKRISPPSADFQERFTLAFENRYPSLLRYAERHVGDRGRAEDVVQQAFENVWRGQQNNPREILNLVAYIQTAVTHAINRELTNVIRLRNQDSLDESDDYHLSAPDNHEQQLTGLAAVATALAMLTPRERDAIVLRVQCDLSVAETAEIMGVSTGAVKRYTSDALRRLRERIAA